jgi:hypothetical protein
MLNGQRLLEFSTTTDDRTASQELRVRVAALWLRVDSKPTSPTNAERRYHRFGANGSFERRNITLWIFRIVRPLTELNNTSFLTDQVRLSRISRWLKFCKNYCTFFFCDFLFISFFHFSLLSQ